MSVTVWLYLHETKGVCNIIRKPEQQVEHMEHANVRPHWTSRRSEENMEQEMADEKKRRQK